jgi:hypothetical protein
MDENEFCGEYGEGGEKQTWYDESCERHHVISTRAGRKYGKMSSLVRTSDCSFRHGRGREACGISYSKTRRKVEVKYTVSIKEQRHPTGVGKNPEASDGSGSLVHS